MSNQCCKPIYFQAFYHHPKSEDIYDVAYCTLHNMFYGRTVQPKIKVVVQGVTRTLSLKLSADFWTWWRHSSKKRAYFVLYMQCMYNFCVMVEVAWLNSFLAVVSVAWKCVENISIGTMSNQCCKPIYFQAFYPHLKSEEMYDVAYCTLHIICFIAGLYSRKQTLSSRAWRELGQSSTQILELYVYI